MRNFQTYVYTLCILFFIYIIILVVCLQTPPSNHVPSTSNYPDVVLLAEFEDAIFVTDLCGCYGNYISHIAEEEVPRP